jgi:hypothetical protein
VVCGLPAQQVECKGLCGRCSVHLLGSRLGMSSFDAEERKEIGRKSCVQRNGILLYAWCRFLRSAEFSRTAFLGSLKVAQDGASWFSASPMSRTCAGTRAPAAPNRPMTALKRHQLKARLNSKSAIGAVPLSGELNYVAFFNG